MRMEPADSPISTDSFSDIKIRINKSFEYLRNEMKEIQRQDIVLLKQLMYIRHTILLLSQYPDRRSYSFNSLEPPSQELTSPEVMRTKRATLCRVQSAPLGRNISEDTISEGDETDDEFAQSFNSTASDSVLSSIRRPSPETDFIYALTPLPPVFKRLLQATATPGDSTATPGECPDPPNSLVHTQHLLRQINSSYLLNSDRYDSAFVIRDDKASLSNTERHDGKLPVSLPSTEPDDERVDDATGSDKFEDNSHHVKAHIERYDASLHKYVNQRKLQRQTRFDASPTAVKPRKQASLDSALTTIITDKTPVGKLKQRSLEEGECFIGRTGRLKLSPQTSIEIEI